MATSGRILSVLLAAVAAILCCAASAAPADYDVNMPQNLQAGHLYAQSALLIDEDSGEVIFSKDSRVRMYPASTTKIMTLMLALESGIPLDAQVTIPAEAADVPKGSSVIPVEPGDELCYEDLLCGFMLTSGNDGANAIAVLTEGSIEAFVARMNARAQELGCENTHYVNAHGYHDSNHYTTARDLAVIAREAMKNADFRRIVAQPSWTMNVTRGGASQTLEIVSRNTLLIDGQKYYYPDCTGIKTGHHNKAGWCFVGSAERDGMRLICVVLNCENEFDKWYDAARLFEYGFTCYEKVTVDGLMAQQLSDYTQVDVEDAEADDPENGRLALTAEWISGSGYEMPVLAGNHTARDAAAARLKDTAKVEWVREIRAPVTSGERLGRLVLSLPDGGEAIAELTASRDVAARIAETPVPAPPDTETVAVEPANTDAGTSVYPGNTAQKRENSAALLRSMLILAGMILLVLTGCAILFSRHMVRGRRRRGRSRHACSHRKKR